MFDLPLFAGEFERDDDFYPGEILRRTKSLHDEKNNSLLI